MTELTMPERRWPVLVEVTETYLLMFEADSQAEAVATADSSGPDVYRYVDSDECRVHDEAVQECGCRAPLTVLQSLASVTAASPSGGDL